ncbi:MAG: gliding motility-associated C-terminal domain-containing protein [Bacteroidia bacterium]|nr:gliding motility-associated C-terminal domain-containing protein [Bacteroidia bacterium]
MMKLYRFKALYIAILICIYNLTFGQTTTVLINASGNWTCPPGVNSATIECWGSGGGGGGATGNIAGGGGGSAGSYSKSIIAVTPLTNYPVTVGAGGTGTTAAGGNGNPTWFNTVGTVYAVGGLGGSQATVNGTSTAGGAAVVAGNIGTTIFYGGAGGTGATGATAGGGGGAAGTNTTGNDGGVTIGGIGGDIGGGNGGNGGLTSGTGGNGNAGTSPGGGGGGGRAGSATDRNGGTGGAGLIRITYLTPPNITPFSDLSFCGGAYPTAYQTVNFSLKERLATDFTRNQTTGRTIILTLPAGFEFNPAAAHSVTKNGGGSDITTLTLTGVTTTTITITVNTSIANPNTNFDEIFFNNFQIRATAIGSGNLLRLSTNPGTFLINTTTQNPLSSESFGFMYSNAATVYNSSSVSQYTTDNINRNCASSRNAVISRLRISVTGGCPPPDVTQFNFNTNGDAGFSQNPLTNISSAKVYFNGLLEGAPVITASTSVFGTISNPNGAFTINGSQKLNQGPGDYYFFLVYDVPVTANVGDGLDASLTSFVMDGSTISNMTTPNPTGKRTIVDEICYTPDEPNPPSNIETIPLGSYVIPMDNNNQALVAPFNLRSYGLVHSLLMNDIPVKWVILSGKAKDAVDFTANASRVYPSAVASAPVSFIASAFIIDSTWINKSFYSTGKTATQVITDYYALGAGYNQVTVYRLTNNENLNVRYTLHQRPKIAVFSNGGNQAIHQTMLDNAGITNYFIQNAGNFLGLAECYTFCSEAHWDFNTNPDINPVQNVLKFVNEGGNFLAQCAGIDLYEDHQPGGGHFHSSHGINFSNVATTNTYSNTDMAFNQYHGVVTTDMGSTIRLFWPGVASAFQPNMYPCISAPLPTTNMVATAAHVGPQDSIGGNVFYLGGHNYSNDNLIQHVNGVRMYLNATLVPAARPTAFTLDAGANRAICIGQSTTLGGSPTGGSGATNYIWSPTTGLDDPNSANPIATPTTTTTYTVIANDNGCPGGPATVTVTVNALPTPTASNTGPFCEGGTIQLNVTAETSYNWSGPGGFTSTLQNPTISGATLAMAGVYSVTVTNAEGCTAISTTTVTVNAIPTPIATNTGPYCEGNTIQLSVTSATSYSWSGPNGFTSTIQNPTISGATLAMAGLYSVTVTNAAGCTASTTTTVTVNALPVPTASNTGPYCEGTTIQLNVTAATSYNWSGPGGFSSILQNPTRAGATLAMAGLYSVTVTNAAGCTAVTTTTVTVNAAPTPVASNTGPYCEGATIQLNVNAAISYNWSGPGGFTSALQNPNIAGSTLAMSGIYSVTVTNAAGCTAVSTTTVTVNAIPTPTATNTGPYCEGSTIQLNVTAATSYNWSGPGGFTSTLQNPTRAGATLAMNGIYSVTVTTAGCSAITTTTVTVNAVPAPVASNTGPYCEGANIQLNVTAGTSYNWSGPGGFSSALQNPTRAGATLAMGGVYSVTVTNAGCAPVSTTTNVIVNALPTPTASNTGPYCEGSTIQLNVTASTSYNWSGPGGFTSALQNPTRAGATMVMTGIYSVTVTNAAGCTAITTTTVTVNANPVPTASNTGPYCEGNTIQLNVTAATSYNWSGPGGFTSALQNPTRAGATLAMAGIYSVTVTNAAGCTAIATTTVTINANPTPTASNTGPYCEGNTIQLNVTAATSYNWSGPGGFSSALQNPTRAGATLAMGGVYSVTVTNASGCTTVTTTTVIVNAIPTPTASNTGPYCVGNTIQLNVTAATSYNWSGPGGFSSALQNPTIGSATVAMSGIYSVTVTNAAGCTAISTTTVTVNNLPTPTASNTGPYCEGSTIQLNVTAATSYNWSGPGGFSSALQNPTRGSATVAMSGIYSVTVTNAAGCTAITTTNVIVSAVPAPTVTNTGPYCEGNTIQLNVTAATTYNWSGPGGFSSVLQNPTRAGATLAMAGVYSVTVTNAGCAPVSSTTTVIVNASPTPTASNTGPYCESATIQLNVSAASSYNWSGPGGFTSALQNPTISGATLAMAGIYSVTVTNAAGCTAITTTTVTVNANPAPTASNTGPYCEGNTIQLNVTAATSYNWSGPGGFTSTLQNPTRSGATLAMTGLYSVTVTNAAGCTAISTTTVTINAIPTPTASNTGPYCVGNTIQLNVTAGTSYSWSGPGGFTSVAQNPTRASATLAMGGVYSVTVTNAAGCTAITTTTVTVNANPVPTASNTGPYCEGNTIQLNVTAGSSYNWSGPSGFTSTSQNPTRPGSTLAMAGIYSVTVTNAAGCTAVRTTTVTVNTLPTPTASNTGPFCEGTTIQLNVTAATTYNWSGPGSFTSTLQNPTRTGASMAMAGLYSVTVTNAAGCTAVSTTTVVIDAIPTPTATNTGPYCEGNTIQLNVTAGTSYNWSGPGGYTSTLQNPTIAGSTLAMAGLYSVTVTNAAGCTALSTTTVIVNALPIPTASNTGPYCEGNTILLNVTAASSYNWSGPDGFSSALQNPTISGSTLSMNGVYSVTVTNAAGCTAITTTTVAVNALPSPTASNTGPYCEGTTIQFNVTAASSYNWSGPGGFSSTLQNPVITGATLAMAGAYSVTVTNAAGCTAITTTNVTINPIPATPSANGTSICINTSTNITATAPGGTYEWYDASSGGTLLFTGATFTSPVLVTNTTYYVQTTISGCTSIRKAVNIIVSPVPASPTASGTGICTGTTATITATAPGGTYQWYDASSGGTLLITGASYTTPALFVPTTYYVQTTIGGCAGPRTAVDVNVNPPPAAPTASGATICQNNSTTLSATAPGGVYEWFNAASGGTLLYTGSDFTTPVLIATTTYYVQSNVFGCIGPRSAITVTVNPIPALPTAPGTSICTGNTAILNASAPGGTYEWYDASSGGTLLQTGSSYTTPALISTTTYYVQTTISGCTSARRAVTVTVNPYPNAPSASGTTICEGTTAILSATAPGGTYRWYNAPTGGTLLFTGANYTTPPLSVSTDYYVQTTVLGCVSTRTLVTVTVTPTPVAPTALGTTICQGTNTILSATAPGGSYDWYDAATGGNLLSNGVNYTTPNLNSTTTYYVQTTISGCAGPRTAVQVTITPTPAAPTASGTTICEGFTATLTATAPGGSYDWYDAATSGNLLSSGSTYTTAALTSTTSFYVQTTVSGCTGPMSTVTVNVTPTDDPSFSYPLGTYCITGTNPIPTITGGFPGSFTSSPAGLVFVSTTTGEVNLAASALNTYSVTYTTTGPCPDSYSANLTITIAPDASFSYSNPYCQEGINPIPTFGPGTSAGVFTSSPFGLTFINPSTGEVDLQNTLPGLYTITNTIPAGGGCALTIATNNLTINTSPTVDAGLNQTICENSQATISGTIGGSASSATWTASSGSFANANNLNTVYTAQAGISSVWLHLTTNDPAGPCSSTNDSLHLTITSLPAAPTANGNTICSGTSTTLTATSPGGSYEWYDAAVGGTLLASAASYNTPVLMSTTTYYVQTTVNGCAGPRTPVIVDVTPLPPAPTVADASICDGDYITLTATAPGGIYEWFDALSGGILLATNANYTTPVLNTSTSYFVQTTVSGCSGPRQEVVVTVNPIPITPTASDISICFGNTGTLAATAPGGTYQWYDDIIAGTLLFTGSSYTTPVLFSNISYYVESTILGCTGPRTQVDVTVNPIPDAPTASGTTICSGETANITATAPGGTYNWYLTPTGGISLFTGASFTTPALTTNTTYYVEATVLGCSSSSRTAVTVNVTPLPDSPTASGISICDGESTILTATDPGGFYEWFDAPTGGTLLASGNSFSTPILNITTSYFVQTTLTGCTGPRTEVIVTVNPIPVLPTVNNISICDGSTGTLTATAPGGTYQWYDAASGGTLLYTGNSFITPPLNATTTYYVQTTVTGCTSGRKAVTVTVKPIPNTPTVSDETICEGDFAILTATAPGGTYRWYALPTGGTPLFTGASFNSPPLFATTTYYVQTTVLGCTSPRTPVLVTVNPIPSAPTALSATICEGFTTTLNATAPGGSYEWFDLTIGGNSLGTGSSYTSSVLTTDTSFFVQTTILGCASPRTEVIVTVTPTDDPTFNYSSGTFCVSGVNPIPTITGGFPGSFTSNPAGLTFVNASTGEVDLSSTLLNTYNITYTTTGPCPTTRTEIITITDAPLATFIYNTPFCQSGSNELPSFGVGASAGVFSALPAGLNFIDAISGEIDMANSTPGNYTITNFIAASGGCAQATATYDIVIDQPATVSAGINIQTCEGFNVPLSGSIGGSAINAIWTGGTGTFNDNTLLNAIYTPFAGESSVTLTLTTDDPSGPCPSVSNSINVIFNSIPSSPTALGATVCENNSTILTATAPGGLYEWFDAVTGGNLLSSDSILTTPILIVTTDYYVQSTINGCTSPRIQVTVNVNPSPTVDAGLSDTLCSNNAISTLAGIIGGSASQGIWTTSGSGNFTPDATTLNATYSPSSADTLAGFVTLFLTTTDQPAECLSVADSIIITYTDAPRVFAGNDKNICIGNNANINGQVFSISGTGTWTSTGDGTFTNPNNLVTVYQPGAGDISSGNVFLILTSTNNNTCNPVSDTLKVNLVVPPTVNAGSDQTVCSNVPALLSGSVSGTSTTGYWSTTGSGIFTPDSTNLSASYQPSATDITNGSVTLTLNSTNSCLVQDQLDLTFILAPTVNAGNNQVVCADVTQINLNGNIAGLTTTGIWSTTGSGIFVPDNTTLNATYQISQQDSIDGSISIILTSTNNGICNAESDGLTLTITTVPTVNAGGNQTFCANNTLSLSGIILGGLGTGQWTTSGTGTFTPSDTSLNATYNPSISDTSSGNITITLTTTGSCVNVSDAINVTITPGPWVDAGTDIAVCANNSTVVLTGLISGATTTGQWTTNGTGVFIPTDTDLNANYIPSPSDTANGSVVIYLEATNYGTCLPANDSIVVTITSSPTINAGNNLSICNGNNAVLNGVVSTLSGHWTTSGTGTFTPSDTILNPVYHPSAADTIAGSVILTLWSDNNGGCNQISDNITLTMVTFPIVNAGIDQTACSNVPVTLNGSITGGNGNGYWTTSGNGTFSPDSSALNANYNISSDDLTTGFVTLTLTASGGCSTNDSVRIDILPGPISDAGSNQAVCNTQTQVTLNGSITGSTNTGIWTSTGSGTFIPNDSTLNATYIFSLSDSIAGIVNLILTSTHNGNCPPAIDTMVVNINSAPTANAGADITACANSTVTLSGIVSSGSSFWSTSGSGTFSPDSSDLNATYHFSNADTTSGNVTLTLNVINACSNTSDSLLITITPAPYVDAGNNLTTCTSSSEVALSGIVSAGASTGIWSTNGTGAFFPSANDLLTNYIPSADDTTAGFVTLYLTSTNNGNCNPISDSLVITFIPTPIVNAGESFTVCNGNIANLNGTITSISGTGIWTSNGTGIFSPSDTLLTTSYNASTQDIDLGFVDLILTSTNLGSCYISDTVHVLFLSGSASIEAGPDKTICWNDSIFITPTILGDTGTFLWTTQGNGTFSPNDTAWNVTYIPDSTDLDSGSIYIYVRYQFTCGTRLDSLLLTINPLPVAGFTSIANCSNTNIVFNDTSLITNGTIDTWLWNFGDGMGNNTSNPTHLYSNSGDYNVTLIVHSNAGCSDTALASVHIYPVISADFSVSDSIINTGNQVQFTDLSLNPVSWIWTFGDETGTSDLQNPQYLYNTMGSYTVWLFVNGENGCTDSTSQTITVNSNGYAIPTAFSPNGDGLNDYFFVRGGPFIEYELRIFNDWGQQIFISNNQSAKWDGTFKGKEQPEGTYIYIFNGKLTDGTDLNISSDISLIR